VASLSTAALIAIFVASGAVIWVAGVWLSSSTDAIDSHFKLGAALGGLVLLAFATNLPEFAITIVAAIKDNLGLAVGNLLGGIAAQTVVLAVLDVGAGPDRPLTYLVGSLLLVVEAVMVVVVTVVAVMTTQLSASTNVAGVSPGTVAIVLFWLAGLWLIVKGRGRQPWKAEPEGAAPGRTARQRRATMPARHRQQSMRAIWAIFGAAARSQRW
jgi:cation:H+ antiporter